MTMTMKVLDISVRCGVDLENDRFSHGQNISILFIYILYKINYVFIIYTFMCGKIKLSTCYTYELMKCR